MISSRIGLFSALVAEFVRMGALRAVINILKAFGTKDAGVAKYGCKALGAVRWGDGFNQIEIDHGCIAVIRALETFGPLDSEVARRGCEAISAFEFCEELIHRGACEAVVRAVDARIRDANVAAAGCWVIHDLAQTRMARDVLGRVGACVIVSKALECHGTTHDLVAEAACQAICSLTNDHVKNRKMLLCLDVRPRLCLSVENVCKQNALMSLDNVKQDSSKWWQHFL